MRNNVLATVVCGLVLIPSPAFAAEISFQQFDWLADGGGYTQQRSAWGKVHVQLTTADTSLLYQQGTAYYAYMNVVTTVPGGATDNWAVQNQPIYFNSLSELIGRGPESLRFDLGTEPGQTRVTARN